MGFLKKLFKVVAIVAVVVGIGMIVAPAFMSALGTAVAEGLSAIGSAISSGFASVAEALGFSSAASSAAAAEAAGAAAAAEAATTAAVGATDALAAMAPATSLEAASVLQGLGSTIPASAVAGGTEAMVADGLINAAGAQQGVNAAAQAAQSMVGGTAPTVAADAANLVATSGKTLVKPGADGMLSKVGTWAKENPLLAYGAMQGISGALQGDPANQQIEYSDWMQSRLNESIHGMPQLPFGNATQVPLRRTDGSQVFSPGGNLAGGGMLQKRFPGYGG